ncbi:dihydrofolate reductase [Marinospirillum celere]|uniref:Dihydrofolate reductase n=1 Tax=Marinospirillum celere TaxID=1122252 RepID=A0A1I1J1X3_9GAMM|nr:dihydrofolate reductase [Marinospirillum celere]SFC39460.1 dihydrofolate reductase [Marinospirillum celere]
MTSELENLDLETPVAIIVAAARNWVIGHQNRMPWYLPEELKHFKRTTLGKPLVMGRATFESIGRPLPGRTNIVVTRNPEFSHPGIKVASSLQEALKLADSQAIVDGAPEIMVMGGGQIYQQAFPLASHLYLTTVEAEPEGDAWFPEVKENEWLEVSRDTYPAQEGNRYAYLIRLLKRKG